MLNFLAAIGSAPAGGGGSFESIATANGTGSSGQITFTSIPSTYQHLQIRALFNGTNSGSSFQSLLLSFNNYATSDYATHYISGTGSAVSASGVTSVPWLLAGRVPDNSLSNAGVAIIDIHDYASTTKNKTVRAITGSDQNGSGEIWLTSGARFNTAAINRIDLLVSGNWKTNTTFALYGIKA